MGHKCESTSRHKGRARLCVCVVVVHAETLWSTAVRYFFRQVERETQARKDAARALRGRMPQKAVREGQ